MNSNSKAILFSFLIFLVIFLITLFFLKGVFNLTDGLITGAIAVIIAAIFSPRRIIVKKKSENEV
ncbi:hypothetical protein N9H78_00570 [Winogradskyella sp.]|nr:hypothetical protein [Winogradskyella sp.]MDA8874150.1 hypothetical protein [Winogradskyella sp.]